jgi:hypothetical protein
MKRRLRLESEDNEVFKQAYLELKDSAIYAKEHFNGFPMHLQLQKQLEKYTPRFNQLSSTNPT